MNHYRRASVAVVCGMFGLAGCGNLQLAEVSPTMMDKPAAVALAAGNLAEEAPGKGYCDAGSAEPAKTTDLVTDIATRANQSVPQSLPGELASDNVVMALSKAIGNVAIEGHHKGRLAASLSTSPRYEGAKRSTAPGSITARDFQAFAMKMAKLVTDPAKLAASDTNGQDFGHGLIRYYMAYYDGKFVDRFGNSISKPDFDPAVSGISGTGHRDTTITDDDVAGAVAVLIEYLADRIVHTPVWTSTAGDGTVTYLPGNTRDEPTALALEIVPAATKLAPDGAAAGITMTKAHAMRYLARSASSKASMIGGLVTGSFGGFGVSLGVFGKVSVGDNKMLQVVIRAGLAHVFERAVEQSSCELLARIPDPASSVTAGQKPTQKQSYDQVLKLIDEMLQST